MREEAVLTYQDLLASYVGLEPRSRRQVPAVVETGNMKRADAAARRLARFPALAARLPSQPKLESNPPQGEE